MRVNGRPALTPRNGLPVNHGEATVTRDPCSGKTTLDTGCGNDNVNISRSLCGGYNVNVNGQNFHFSEAEFKNLEIKTGSGSDKVEAYLAAMLDTLKSIDKRLSYATIKPPEA